MAVFRVEKTRDFTVMSNHHLRNRSLSLKAKGLQSLMLSLPESWDFTTKGLSVICKDGVDSITNTLSELEKHGYLTRSRLRDERGRLSSIEYTIHEQPIEQENPETAPSSPKGENPVLEEPVLEEPVQDSPVLENPAQLSINKSNTHKEKIHSSRTHLSIYPSTKPYLPDDVSALARDAPMDGMDRMEAYRGIIMDNIEYDILAGRYGYERLDEAVEIMLEAVCSQREYIRVAGDEFPREAVKSRLLKLTSSHIEYAFGCIDKHTGKVRNIKAFLLTTLYNAPATMDSYYRAEVAHDLYGA